MATPTSDRAEPVNRIAGLLAAPERTAPAAERRLELPVANADPEPWVTWTSLAAGTLALLATFLWPAFLVALVLLLVLLTPFVAIGCGVAAIRRSAHRSS
jgi:hypothetical protein